MGFRDAQLERAYQLCRNRALRRNDLQLLKYAFAMNVAFNCITILVAQKGVAAGLLYCSTLLAHAAALKLLQPDTYVAYRNFLASCWRLSWHVSCILGLRIWSEPFNESAACFVKILTFLSGVVALNWLHAFTVLSNSAQDFAVQAVAALGYMKIYTPRHVCPLVMQHAPHVVAMRRVWGILDGTMRHLGQLLPFPIEMVVSDSSMTNCSSSVGSSSNSSTRQQPLACPLANSAGSSSSSSNNSYTYAAAAAAGGMQYPVERMCLQATMFLQIMVGLLVPCLLACWSDFAARRRFLCEHWQQHDQKQQRQQHADGSSSAAVAAAGAECQELLPHCSEVPYGDVQEKELLDHPLEWVFHYPSITVGLVLLSVAVWFVLGELSVVFVQQQ